MCEKQEGGARPLRESAPIYQAEPGKTAARPLPPCFAAAALVSYLPAYLYVEKIFLGSSPYDWGLTVFALVFIVCVEVFARAVERQTTQGAVQGAPAPQASQTLQTAQAPQTLQAPQTAQAQQTSPAPQASQAQQTSQTPQAVKETPFWALAWLALSLCMWAYGGQAGGLEAWQFLAWHLFAVWYTLARCGMLAAGHSGALSFLDALAGLFTVPWPGMCLRIKAFWQARQRRRARRAGRPSAPEQKKRFWTVLASAALALALCIWAWGQLAAADANFAALGQRLTGWWRWPDRYWPARTVAKCLLSLPVGAWLFGLVGGSLRRSEPPVPAETFWQKLMPRQKLPALTVHLVLGALCAVYALFFAVQACSFAAAALPGGVLDLSAPTASQFAVSGFWELCRILLLGFALLVVLRFFGPALRQKRSVKALAAVFCGFGIAFALLAAVKLGVYIRLYAFTPRRVLSGWFLGVLLFWAVLALCWVLGVKLPFGPARLGVYGFVLAFVLLGAVNMNALVVRLDVALYNAGQANALDAQVLADCGVGTEVWWSYGRGALDLRPRYAAWLVDSGWFCGQSRDTIQNLYRGGPAAVPGPDALCNFPDNGACTVQIAPDCALEFTFEGGVCTAAALEKT